ncbi:MAG: Asp-tRNA(Asn)/Glu-tRNA(Gln) amidotransferase subunit GatA [Chloroflexi bacterium]|nr:Asp-tRNA(Asn)/Glu-tRNA(Gln) amidotransferase subunit GatA [Chloroflexota bacterium]
MSSKELHYLSIAEAAQRIAAKELSPVELVEAHLERIAETAEKLNTFVTLLADEAREAARKAEAEIQGGGYRGPLHGIPVGLKDLYYTRGIRTTMGSKIMGDFVPDYDAAVTESFHQAGAILMGKLQMHEFALGGTSENPHYGAARNPWNVDRITGGSSGGSGAAVASGQCMGALGSDTGGSVRIPAGACGIVGLKPTYGLVSRHGVFPLSHSLDTVGPMTRTVRDAAIIMNAIAGHDARDSSSANRPKEDYTAGLDEGVRGLRVGVPQEYFYEVIDDEVADAVKAAAAVLEGLGASVEDASIPILDQSIPISGALLLAEAAEVHMDNLRHRPDDLGADVRARLQVGAATLATDYIKAQRARVVFNRDMSIAMNKYDLLLAPTVAIGAPRMDQELVAVGGGEQQKLAIMPRLTRPFNITGTPTVSVPCGFTSDGMPIGIQLSGRVFEDALVLRAAQAYENATEWHTRRPPI